MRKDGYSVRYGQEINDAVEAKCTSVRETCEDACELAALRIKPEKRVFTYHSIKKTRTLVPSGQHLIWDNFLFGENGCWNTFLSRYNHQIRSSSGWCERSWAEAFGNTVQPAQKTSGKCCRSPGKKTHLSVCCRAVHTAR